MSWTGVWVLRRGSGRPVFLGPAGLGQPHFLRDLGLPHKLPGEPPCTRPAQTRAPCSGAQGRQESESKCTSSLLQGRSPCPPKHAPSSCKSLTTDQMGSSWRERPTFLTIIYKMLKIIKCSLRKFRARFPLSRMKFIFHAVGRCW